MNNGIVIIDYGSQYNQLIARRVRENHVYCSIVPPSISLKKLKDLNPKGVILSGGPSSVYDKKAPKLNKNIADLNVPILGICYGMQLISEAYGGRVKKTKKREYGKAILCINSASRLFSGIPKKINCWMSHGDYVCRIPKNFTMLAHTHNTKYASISCKEKDIYGVQFHPEVVHTQYGAKIITNFIFNVCNCRKNWTMKSFIKNKVKEIKNEIGSQKIILGLSGGVDSSVCAFLLKKALGNRLHCIFVDNGLLRKYERRNVEKLFKKHFTINLHVCDARSKFVNALNGVKSPEKKRKIIGKVFIQVFEKEAKKIGSVKYLAQGTLYPDIIESKSAFGGPSAVIKSHHNVGGLPKKMGLKVLEPLNELFKDEVRALGKELGMSKEVIFRQPFPGPGLAVRIIGEITKKRLSILRDADSIIVNESKKYGLYYTTWQTFGVLLPVKTVGIMGDKRTYENVIAIRSVTSNDGMTADWSRLPHEALETMSSRIINEVKGVNRVVYDISSKPPSTIEWE